MDAIIYPCPNLSNIMFAKGLPVVDAIRLCHIIEIRFSSDVIKQNKDKSIISSPTSKVEMTGLKDSSHCTVQMFNSRLFPHHELGWAINLITNQLKDAAFSIICSELKG